jgi:hypothetical protein
MPPYREKKIITLDDYSVMGPEYQRRVQEIDPDLVLAYHKTTGWAVFREESDERGTFHRRIAFQRTPEAQFDIDDLCNGLRARDTHLRGRSHVDQMEKHLADLAAEEEQKARAAEDAIRPVLDRMAYYAAKDSGDLSKFIHVGAPKTVVD